MTYRLRYASEEELLYGSQPLPKITPERLAALREALRLFPENWLDDLSVSQPPSDDA
jgi:hypothetical protein